MARDSGLPAPGTRSSVMGQLWPATRLSVPEDRDVRCARRVGTRKIVACFFYFYFWKPWKDEALRATVPLFLDRHGLRNRTLVVQDPSFSPRPSDTPRVKRCFESCLACCRQGR